MKAIVDAVGVDHVEIGSDTDLLAKRPGQGTNRAWPGLSGGFFNTVAGEVRRRGFTSKEVASIAGSNYARVFARATSGHT